MKKVGMYIHIPFCKQKCFYCDFISFAAKEMWIEKYIQAIKDEIGYQAVQNKGIKIDTVYIGGGTPSLLEPRQIEDILETIRNNFTIEKQAEITMEINPRNHANTRNIARIKNNRNYKT